MAAGYVIAQLKVTNPENYTEYVAKVSEVVKNFDGEYQLVMENIKLLREKIVSQDQ